LLFVKRDNFSVLGKHSVCVVCGKNYIEKVANAYNHRFSSSIIIIILQESTIKI